MITCGNCGAEVPTTEPCPKCGKKIYNLVCQAAAVTVSGSLGITLGGPTVNALPPLALGALVTPYGKVAEGSLVVAVGPAWKAFVAALEKDPNFFFQLDPRKFEELLAAAYDQAGFDEVILTPRSGDGGRDVIATKKGLFTVRFIEQAKLYSPGHLVTADEVRSLVGVLSMDTLASKGLVTTTSDFAPGCYKEFANWMPTRLELVNGRSLQPRFSEILNLNLK